MKSRQLRIVIPAHNESERIVHTLADYCAAFAETGTIVVVANACTDDTVKVIERLRQKYDNLELLAIHGKIGKGGAIRAGLKMGGAEPYVGFVDADASTAASEFARLLDHCKSVKCDGVIGSRWSKGSVVEPRQPWSRRFASRCFNGLVRAFFGLRFRDTQCGAKVFRRDAIDPVLCHLELANFAFDVDLLFQLKEHGKRIVELPIRWSDAGGSKVRLVPSSISMFMALLRLRLRNSRAKHFPYVEYIGRHAVIPVNVSHKVVMLNHRYDAIHDKLRDVAMECTQLLEQRGFTVQWMEDLPYRGSEGPGSGLVATVMDRLRFFLWYAYRSTRDADALVELESGTPSFVPYFSVKPKFLITSNNGRNAVRAPYGEEKTLVVGDGTRGADLAEAILAGVGTQSIYGASFSGSAKAWSLRFSELDSGVAKHKALK